MKTQKQLKAQEIEQNLIDIVKRRFDGLLKITSNTCNGEIANWNISFDEIFHFPVCLKTEQNVDFIHEDMAWNRWAQQIIEEELAHIYHAELQDEEYPKHDLPPPEKHPTFRAYLETSMIHHSKCWKRALIEIECSKLPSALKKF